MSEDEATPPRKEARKTGFGPIESKRISDVIADRVATAIRDGSYSPGDRLFTENELAREFGVGRTSVREGLQKLRAFGIVEVRTGQGAYIPEPGDDDPLRTFIRWTTSKATAIEELLEARMALETLASALAAVRADDEEIAAIAEAHAGHLEAGERKDLDGVISWDQTFHDRVMAAAHNPMLARMQAVAIADFAEIRRNTLALPWAPERSAHGHEAILEAIRAHDPAAARTAMADHLYVLYVEVSDAAGQEGDAPLALAAMPRDALS